MLEKLIGKYFAKPTAQQLREEQLSNYERHLVEMESQAAYSTKMVELYSENIRRLKHQLGHNTTCSPTNVPFA